MNKVCKFGMSWACNTNEDMSLHNYFQERSQSYFWGIWRRKNCAAGNKE